MSVKKAASLSSATTSAWYPVDTLDLSNGPISLVTAGTFVATYDIEFTSEDPYNDPATGKPYAATPTLEAQKHSTLVDQTAAANGVINSVVTAIRLNVTAYTSGTVDLYVGQGSMG